MWRPMWRPMSCERILAMQLLETTELKVLIVLQKEDTQAKLCTDCYEIWGYYNQKLMQKTSNSPMRFLIFQLSLPNWLRPARGPSIEQIQGRQ